MKKNIICVPVRARKCFHSTGCLFSFRPPAEVPGVRGAPAGEALDMTVSDIAFEREDGQLSLF